MTNKQFQRWLIHNLRRLHLIKYRPKDIIWKNARVARGDYQCNKCKGIFKRPNLCLDHIKPVIDPKKGFVDWNTYIPRMFTSENGYQILCTECHQKKTNKENNKR